VSGTDQQQEVSGLSLIRARAQKATPGPWEFFYVSGDVNTKTESICGLYGDRGEDALRIDGAFIAHARTDIELLCDIAEAAARLHAGLTAKHDPMDVDDRIDALAAALARLDEA
jgi:hypothetical protein